MRELGEVLANVPQSSGAADYREAILQRNVLGKTTDSTRQKSLRHLRKLYALDEATPIFGFLRRLHAADAASLPLLALGDQPPSVVFWRGNGNDAERFAVYVDSTSFSHS